MYAPNTATYYYSSKRQARKQQQQYSTGRSSHRKKKMFLLLRLQEKTRSVHLNKTSRRPPHENIIASNVRADLMLQSPQNYTHKLVVPEK
jgi:hypothetical protein